MVSVNGASVEEGTLEYNYKLAPTVTVCIPIAALLEEYTWIKPVFESIKSSEGNSWDELVVLLIEYTRGPQY